MLLRAPEILAGVTAMAITDAILAGERDPARLAALADRRIKASRATLIKALQGDWRPEHLFTLQQARQTHAHYQKLIDMCDQQIQAAIRALEAARTSRRFLRWHRQYRGANLRR